MSVPNVRIFLPFMRSRTCSRRFCP
jgi:hypothetical protein